MIEKKSTIGKEKIEEQKETERPYGSYTFEEKSGPFFLREEAKRDNKGKTPYAYLPMDLLEGAARVMEFGAQKYGLNNFRKGYSDLKSPLNSLMRHIVSAQEAILLGEDSPSLRRSLLKDEDSGLSHIDHIITSALLLKQAIKVKEEDEYDQ